LSHKQELTNQRSQHSHDKVAQDRALQYSTKELRDYYKVARQDRKCDIGLRLPLVGGLS